MDFLWLLSSIRNPVLDTIMLAFSYIGTPFVIAGIIGWIYLNKGSSPERDMGSCQVGRRNKRGNQ